MKHIVILMVALLCAVFLAGPALATDYEWNGGGSDALWTTRANWDVDPGADNWPGKDKDNPDAVVVPYESNQPQLDFENTGIVYLTSLKILRDPSNPPNTNTVRLIYGEPGPIDHLYVYDVEGLVVQKECILHLDGGTHLHLEGGGALVLDGRIENGAGGQASILLADHKTFVTKGTGTIRGKGTGHDNVLQISGGVLVLGPYNQINGGVYLYSQTVNYGLIDPYYSGSTGGQVMYLNCEPKLGPGEWSVTGGINDNFMEVWTPIAGSGDLTLNSGGFLLVHRSIVLYGSLSMSGGQVSIDAEVLFDVGGLNPADCPVDE